MLSTIFSPACAASFFVLVQVLWWRRACSRKWSGKKYDAEKDGGSLDNVNILKQKKNYAMVQNQYKHVVKI